MKLPAGLMATLIVVASPASATVCMRENHIADVQGRSRGEMCSAEDLMANMGPPGPVRSLSTAYRVAIMAAVSETLHDPVAARFRLGPSQGPTGLYCGFVSSRNTSGGHLPKEEFVVFLTAVQDRPLQVSLIASGTDAGPLCEAAGYAGSKPPIASQITTKADE